MPPELGILVRNTVVTLLLALVAAATWLFATWQRPEPDAGCRAQPTTAQPLGYYVHGARMTGTDEQGRVTYRVLAERLDELPDEDRLQLTGVSVEYQPADETAWSISAASASSPRGGSPLDLVGNVELKSVPTDGSRASDDRHGSTAVLARHLDRRDRVDAPVQLPGRRLAIRREWDFARNLKGDTLG